MKDLPKNLRNFVATFTAKLRSGDYLSDADREAIALTLEQFEDVANKAMRGIEVIKLELDLLNSEGDEDE